MLLCSISEKHIISYFNTNVFIDLEAKDVLLFLFYRWEIKVQKC